MAGMAPFSLLLYLEVRNSSQFHFNLPSSCRYDRRLHSNRLRRSLHSKRRYRNELRLKPRNERGTCKNIEKAVPCRAIDEWDGDRELHLQQIKFASAASRSCLGPIALSEAVDAL